MAGKNSPQYVINSYQRKSKLGGILLGIIAGIIFGAGILLLILWFTGGGGSFNLGSLGSLFVSATPTPTETFTATAIRETDDAIALAKYGRLITASYETVRTQRIDIFAVMLRAVGRKLAAAIAGSALTAVTSAVTPIETATTSLAYADLTNLYAQFTDYDLTTVIASPAVIGTILAMEQMAERTLDANGNVRLPFGAKLIASSALDDKTLVGISKDYAVACLMGSDVMLESDRLIDCQLDRIAVSVRAGFQPLMTGAAAVLEVKTGA